MSLRLHKTLGVNPHQTFCPLCKEDHDQIVLIGANVRIYACTRCRVEVYGGHAPGQPCPTCGGHHTMVHVSDIKEGEKIPANCPCVKCQAEQKEHADAVAAGGVYWRCRECKKQGVIIAESEMAKAIRAAAKIEPPAKVGVEFEKCLEHQPESKQNENTNVKERNTRAD